MRWAAAVAVLVGLVVLVVLLRAGQREAGPGRSGPGPKPGSGSGSGSGNGSGGGGGSSGGGGSGSAPDLVTRPVVPDDQPQQPIAETLDEAARRIRVAARGCPPGRTRPEDQLFIQYTLVLSGGVAHVDELKKLESSLADASVEKCMLSAIAALRWSVDGADRREPITDTLVVGQLSAVEAPVE